MPVEVITYSVDVTPIRENQLVESNCNAIGFINCGDTIAIVNSVVTLNPGASWQPFESVRGDKDVTQYKVEFNGTGNNVLVVTRKRYN